MRLVSCRPRTAGPAAPRRHNRLVVLDGVRHGVLEDDVGDPGGHPAVAGAGADAEAPRGGVGGLADEVARAGVADDRVLHPVLVDDGGDGAAPYPARAGAPAAARGRYDDIGQGLRVQRLPVGLHIGGAGRVQRVGLAVAVDRRLAVAVDVEVGLPEDGTPGAADGHGRGAVRVGAVAAAGDLGTGAHLGQQIGGGHGALGTVLGGPGRRAGRGGGGPAPARGGGAPFGARHRRNVSAGGGRRAGAASGARIGTGALAMGRGPRLGRKGRGGAGQRGGGDQGDAGRGQRQRRDTHTHDEEPSPRGHVQATVIRGPDSRPPGPPRSDRMEHASDNP